MALKQTHNSLLLIIVPMCWPKSVLISCTKYDTPTAVPRFQNFPSPQRSHWSCLWLQISWIVEGFLLLLLLLFFFLQNKQSLRLPSLFFLIICFAFEFCFLICDNSHLTSLLKTSSQSLSEKSIIFPEETKCQKYLPDKNFWMLLYTFHN